MLFFWLDCPLWRLVCFFSSIHSLHYRGLNIAVSFFKLEYWYCVVI
jgi:hypothetical protein